MDVWDGTEYETTNAIVLYQKWKDFEKYRCQLDFYFINRL